MSFAEYVVEFRQDEAPPDCLAIIAASLGAEQTSVSPGAFSNLN